MSDSISVLFELRGKMLVVKIAGQIDESARFDSAWKTIQEWRVPYESLGFDVSQVNQINSVGIREWLVFLGKVQAHKPCRFLLVGEVFVDQASMISNILGRAGTPVEQFEAPYFCASCKLRTLKTLTPKDVAGRKIPSFNCEKCKSPLKFDAVEEEFLSFVANL